jgi:hypothetical protein
MARKGSSPPKPVRRVRVRSRPLAQIDEAKLAVALSIMARSLIEERVAATTPEAAAVRGRREVA